MIQPFMDTTPFSLTHAGRSCSLLMKYEAFYLLAEITEGCGEKHMIFSGYKIMAEPPNSSVFASLLPPVGNAPFPKIIKHKQSQVLGDLSKQKVRIRDGLHGNNTAGHSFMG